MPDINAESPIAVQPELISGESVLRTERRNAGVIFHNFKDTFLVPFSLLWGSFADVDPGQQSTIDPTCGGVIAKSMLNAHCVTVLASRVCSLPAVGGTNRAEK
jgi:hypothetical protein